MVASGIDISPTAVALAPARVRGGNPNRRCGSACFSVGSATSIPFGAHAFDAIMSTDALEHLQPHEVAPMVREFTRVARRRLFLPIAVIPERQEVQKLHDTSDQFDCVTTLHTLHICVKDVAERFRSRGLVNRPCRAAATRDFSHRSLAGSASRADKLDRPSARECTVTGGEDPLQRVQYTGPNQ